MSLSLIKSLIYFYIKHNYYKFFLTFYGVFDIFQNASTFYPADRI